LTFCVDMGGAGSAHVGGGVLESVDATSEGCSVGAVSWRSPDRFDDIEVIEEFRTVGALASNFSVMGSACAVERIHRIRYPYLGLRSSTLTPHSWSDRPGSERVSSQRSG
jgi:hypothetical protein